MPVRDCFCSVLMSVSMLLFVSVHVPVSVSIYVSVSVSVSVPQLATVMNRPVTDEAVEHVLRWEHERFRSRGWSACFPCPAMGKYRLNIYICIFTFLYVYMCIYTCIYIYI